MKFRKFLAFLCLVSVLFSLPINAATVTEENQTQALTLNAKGAIIGETTNDTVLFEQDADKKLFPASTTKLMTALVAYEHLKMDDVITVSKTAVEGLAEQGSNVFLMAGEEMKASDMLRYLLIPSGNDGANALAEHISGSNEAFSKLMNDKAKELGCDNTHFTNPNGLHDEEHYTSARDLYKIAKAAMAIPELRQIVSEQQVKLAPTNMHPGETTITTTNLLISRIKDGRYFYKGAFGIKTGTTTPAGFCLIGGMESGDLQYISVVLGGEKDAATGDIGCYTETLKMFNYAKKNFSSQTLVEKGKPIKEVPVRFSSGAETIVLTAANDFTKLTEKGVDISKVEYAMSIQKDIDAPIEKGQTLGSATISIDGKVYGDIDLVSSSTVERSNIKYYLFQIGNFFKSTAFKIILAALIALVLLLVFIRISNKRRRRRNRYRGTRRR